MARARPSRLPLRQGFLAAAVILAGAAAARADVVTVTDATGRSVAVEDASRIVSIGGAVTEILYALGAEKQVVAVDTTSLYPPQALQEKPNVGYMRALSPEGVLGLNPSVILTAEGAGPKEAVAVLETAKVPFVLVPDPFSGDGILEKVRIVAAVAGKAAQGRCLAEQVRQDLAAMAKLRQRVTAPKKVLFILSFQNGRAMVAGRHTAADGIIRLAGADNAVNALEGYKPVNDESIIAADPDLVLTMQRGDHAMTADAVFANPALATTAAGKAKAFVTMDGHYLLSFGPRTARAARDLAKALYPALAAADALPSETTGEARQGCR